MEDVNNGSGNTTLNAVAGTSEMVDDGETIGIFRFFVFFFF